MAGLMDILDSALSGNVQNQLGQQIGAGPQETGNAVQAALPMLLSGLTHNASQPGGAAALLGALQRDHAGGGLLDNLSGLINGNVEGQAADGQAILGHILGDRQDAAHQAVAKASGLDTGQASQLLATLAPIVMGALGRVQSTQGLNANELASTLQDEHASVAQAQPGLMGLATRLLDRNHDGSALDDVISGLGGLLRKN